MDYKVGDFVICTDGEGYRYTKKGTIWLLKGISEFYVNIAPCKFTEMSFVSIGSLPLYKECIKSFSQKAANKGIPIDDCSMDIHKIDVAYYSTENENKLFLLSDEV